MPYFADHYDAVRLPYPSDQQPGLRRSQLGAIHAIASHFTLRSQPAIVTMPTGSGKTAVLFLAAFLLRANRVLVVTPSRLLRYQVADAFRSLAVLRASGSLPASFDALPGPAVQEVDHRLPTPEAWEALRDFDVVVGTPQSVSPAIAQVAPPPADLFDLVLVDEGHHSAAHTWRRLLDAFPEARRVLFTATPFRQDRQEITGRFVYTYPVAEAYKDGIFGQINYRPVEPPAGVSSDLAIARAAAEVFAADRARGYRHALMVRTETKKRADELALLYAEHTNLRLATVHSGLSKRRVMHVLSQLRAGELDGIICVDMLGEGFDFPELKIAAVHSPHKSLAVTLQFIGRFARTNAAHLGGATFLAVPSEIQVEAERLYEESATWEEIIPHLLERRVQEELDNREDLGTFEVTRSAEGEIEDLSLYALHPQHHVKVYRAGNVAIGRAITLPAPWSVVHQQVSHELATTVLIAKVATRPRWTHLPLFDGVKYELFVVYHDAATDLLFICASHKNDSLYDAIAREYGYAPRPLPLSRVNRALLGLTNARFFNIGMRSRVHGSKTESYRIITGSNAHTAISRNDGRLYHRGHAYGLADDNGTPVTIGLTSNSKIWSNASSQLPGLVRWCKRLAAKLVSDGHPRINSQLDFLSVGEEVAAIPEGVIAAAWHDDVYRSAPTISSAAPAGARTEYSLLDLDVVVDCDRSDTEAVRVLIQGPDFEWPLIFRLDTDFYLTPEHDGDPGLVVERKGATMPLLDYLNARPPYLYFADFSLLVGHELFRQPEGLIAFDPDQIEAIDWAVAGIDVTTEVGEGRNGMRSVQDYVRLRLEADDADIVLFDHGSGELADYVAIRETARSITFEVYHCKGSGGEGPGDRINDAYEVCGQVVKTVTWTHQNAQLVERIRRRLRRTTPSEFLRGDFTAFKELIDRSRGKACRYEIIIVQPGISRSRLSQKMADLLAAADEFVVGAYCERLRVWGSA